MDPLVTFLVALFSLVGILFIIMIKCVIDLIVFAVEWLQAGKERARQAEREKEDMEYRVDLLTFAERNLARAVSMGDRIHEVNPKVMRSFAVDAADYYR
jgi:hypothetical protein